MARTGGFSTMLDAATRRAFNFLRGEVDTLDERVTIIESGGGGDFPEAPLDGQQYGRQSAAWSVIELDDGEHVLTGDPGNPPAGLDAGQLLWDGVEGGSGGGGGGPHDHAEYALVEHDHDEYAMAEMSQEVVKFETPGTFEFKKADYPNLSFITVEVVGGGGAGGSALACEANEASVGAGGGSGGYGFRTIKAVDLADVESVVVGAGGTPDSARSVVDVADGAETVAATGGDGEASLAFAINSHGGRGGGTVKTASGDPYLNTLPGGGGGSYGTKDFGVGGGPGTPPFAHTHRSVGGNGGGVMFAVGGGGGNAVTATGQAGFNGRSGGGGGGGANRAGNNVLHLGGNGGDGVVIVTVFSATGSGSGGGGPHDHDEYALVEHDDDEFVHEHDYLPLSGGTLDSGAQIKARGTNATAPAYSFAANPGVGMYLMNGVDGIVGLSGELRVSDHLRVGESLYLDGGRNDSRIYKNGAADRSVLIVRSSDDDGSARLVLYGGADNSSYAGHARMMIGDSIAAEWNENGEVFRIAEGVDTADVLDSADDNDEAVTVNEVVTALLAKVKQLSAEIKELRGA